MIDIIFDQYQRYKNAQKIVNSIRKNNETFNILEVGANEHKNLEKFLPSDKVKYLDITLPENLLNDPQYILGDATKMDFEDNSYDIVIALDVYEHIPKEKRESFITEIYRVAKQIAIISAPFNNKEVEMAEYRANTFYKSLIGVNHLWIYEHINYGLPNVEELEMFLGKHSIEYRSFSHGDIDLWEKLTNIQSLIQLDSGVEEYVIEIDKYYNEFIFEKDYCDIGYRNFYVFEKEIKIDFEVEKKHFDKLEINSLIDNLYKMFELRMRLGAEKPKLPLFGYNIIMAYVDYGRGYNNIDSMSIGLNVECGDHVVLKDFLNEHVSSIRIDPTERQGDFAFTDLIIKNDKGENINWKLESNCNINRGTEYLFFKKDPQIIIKLDNEIVSSVEFNIIRLKDYENLSEVAMEVIQSLNVRLEELKEQNNLILNSTEGIFDIIKKLKGKFINKFRSVK